MKTGQVVPNALPKLLKELKDGGYRVVQIVGKDPVVPKPEYVEAVLKEVGGGMADARPVGSVVRTISESSNAAPPITAMQR